MNFMRNQLLLLAIALFTFGCTSGNTEPSSQPSPATPAKEEAATNTSTEALLPSMTKEAAQKLYTTVDQIDILFHDMGISMSQSNPSEARAQVAFLAPGQAPAKPPCKAMANIIYQGGGDILADGQLYLDRACRCVVFYEDGKPTYSALLTDQALSFYAQVLGGEVQDAN